MKALKLNLDDLFGDSYFYTEYDLCGYGHAVVIKEKDKNKFLDEFTRIFRERTEEYLEETKVVKNSCGDYEEIESED